MNGIQDPGDPALKNRLVIRTPGSNYSISDQTGYYAGYGVNVNYLLAPLIPFPSLISSNPGSHQAALSSVNPIDDDNHFGWYPNSAYNDLAVEITSPGGLGYFLPRAFYITCINRSIDSADAAIRFIFDPAFSVDSVLPAADSTNAGNYYWDLGKLAPFEEKTVNIHLLNTTILPGAFSILTAFAYPLIGDITPPDNSDTLQVSVFGAYDPNMKTVEPNGSITPSQVAAGQWLDYTIQFQNIGNDTAHRVIIADTLSPLLDLATLDVIGASHSYNLTLDANRLLVVRMDNIQLPDSAANPAGSSGFFRFRIKPITSLSLGDSILNSAAIFFDVNPPIITNETVVKIELFISLGEPAENYAKIYPNITSSWIYLDNSSSAMKGDLEIQLTDMMGRIVMQKIIRSAESRIPLADMGIFPNGVYVAKVSGAGKTALSRIVKTW
ncbi:MAG: T9SS type A sorting domain-containing protein [Bacteroidetes bacterium]|nr:T9SS type A sorting domain-containing protein [Bacteroidota bacterium]